MECVGERRVRRNGGCGREEGEEEWRVWERGGVWRNGVCGREECGGMVWEGEGRRVVGEEGVEGGGCSRDKGCGERWKVWKGGGCSRDKGVWLHPYMYMYICIPARSIKPSHTSTN